MSYQFRTLLYLSPIALLSLVPDSLSIFSFKISQTQLLVLLIGILFIACVPNLQRTRLPKHGENILSLFLPVLFLMILMVTSVFGSNMSQSFWGSQWRHQGVIHYGLYVLYFYVGAMNTQTTEPNRKAAAWVIVASTTLLSLIVLYQALLRFGFNSASILTYNNRLLAPFENPNLLALHLILSLPFCYYLQKTLKTKRLSLTVKACACLLVLSSLFTFSKTALLLVGIVFLFTIFPRPGKNGVDHRILLVCVVFTVLAAALLDKLPFVKNYQYENRLDIWSNGMQAFIRHPLTGYGWGNFAYAMKEVVTLESPGIFKLHIDRAHNEILELLVTSGIFGALIFLMIVFQTYKLLVKKWKKSRVTLRFWYESLGLAFSMILVFLQGNFILTDGYLYLWFIIGAIYHS